VQGSLAARSHHSPNGLRRRNELKCRDCLPDLAPGELALVKSSAERRFYEACRAQLPAEWTVLFSTPWVGTTPAGRKYDGEADFVLLVPDARDAGR
jgi:hypothetical protein